jgi:hypothetical protein
MALAVGEVEELARVAGDQVEPVVQRRVALDALEVRAHADVRPEIVADQESAGTGRGGLALALAIVGNGGEAAGLIDAQPGSSGLEIPSAQNSGAVGPERRRRGRAVVKLVAVGRDHQGIVGV